MFFFILSVSLNLLSVSIFQEEKLAKLVADKKKALAERKKQQQEDPELKAKREEREK